MRLLRYLMVMSLGFSTCWAQIANPNIHPDLIPLLDPELAPFYHGVASGDPTTQSVVIWTKVTLSKDFSSAAIDWEIAEDKQFNHIVRSGKSSTNAEHDFTLKIEIDGLKEGTKYYYRFAHKGTYSIIGETQLIEENPQEQTIAFASCSNYEWGYFNNYRFMTENPDIDLVVHLGDYIYEYAPGGYGDTTLGRINIPNKEIVTLDDYRTRYSQYRLDKDLIKLHQMKPFITTWDDHEIANNGYVDGAQNHQPDKEGDWMERKSAGTQAYYEWLPISDKTNYHLNRSFRFGSLIDLVILDTRIEGRTKQVNNIADPNYNDSTRTILGKDQYNWLVEHLNDSSMQWKIIGNQVPFGPLYQPNMKGEAFPYMDGWDGYPFERTKLINTIQKNNVKNVVWVTGDYHVSFALENNLNAAKTSDDNASVEFIVTSITSANDDEWMDRSKAVKGQLDYLKFNPHCKYLNNVDNGYLVLTINKEKVVADFYYAATVKEPTNKYSHEKSFEVISGKSELIER